jgi:hypothetical protein
MSLHRLLFQPSEPDDSANVGAYLRDASGNLLTSTDVGGKQSLDVNVTDISITDLDIRDLDASQDNVAISDGTDTLAVNADGSINSVVTATDLDIRDISASTDNIAISDGTDTLGVNADGSINSVVTATDLDIRELSAATDSVAAWAHDGSGNLIGSTGGSLDVNVTNDIDVNDGLANTAISVSQENVTAVGGKLITTDLTDRKHVWIYNNGTKTVFLGPSGVTSSDGFPLFKGGILPAEIGAAVAIHCVSATGTQDVRVMQAS